ncbi:hypothetical protein ELQ35_01750 [Peribacillus cavernae]|uniref:Uncharacterized protein n=1 Tax=Peribacillus cavernae TaxID=1674310 RepID=A0A433HWY1_9BACI|nr:hypothetical protein [Peribacillus cavernae]MDQ0221125.1 hypothetical protein [Peribacillus cavernae]RUQ32832.1 hypothetical protein ELQ35_01750 [Peribacillus cavernae]
MKKIAYVILIISIMLAVVCFLLPLGFDVTSHFNFKLKSSSNLVSYLGLLFSLMAVIVSSFAFIIAVKEPNLTLSVLPWMAEEEGPALYVNKDTRKVTMTRPLSSWHFLLHNSGNAAAKYPVVEIIFKNVYFTKDAFEGWQAVHHANAHGWYGFQWTPEDRMIVHPKFPIKLPPMYFDQDYIGDNASVTVTIVADGFNAKSLNMPIKLEFVDFD